MSNHKREARVNFDDALTKDDYGLIVGKNGELKGIWIPDGADDADEIPESVAILCMQYFNLDPNAKEHEERPMVH
tara:strand:+ start:502 stop:726 length:225 start_codon:yes stop_codon:yes gene_type:complete